MQSNINTKKYSPFNLAQFKMWLQDMKEKGETKFFEIYVNDFKVVPKTDNPDDFESHEQYVDDETLKVRVLVYNTKDSNRYKQNVFILKEASLQTGALSGIEVEKKIEDEVNKGLKAVEERMACEQVKKELAETKEKLGQAEEYSEKLASHIESLNEKLENAKNTKEILNIVTEYGAQLLGKKKTSTTLSGAQTEKKPDEEASFKMKSSEEGNSLSENEKHFVQLGKMMIEKFNEQEFEKIMCIIDSLADNKTNIDPVISLLNITINPQKTTRK